MGKVKNNSKNCDPQKPCPISECLKFLAGAWTIHILWYLRDQKRRFGELKRDLSAISARVLTIRLRELESSGIVTRTVQSTSPPTVEYELTSLGKEFHPILEKIYEVSTKLNLPAPEQKP